jgi:hypothetical protein
MKSKPSSMTREEFNALADKIRNNSVVQITPDSSIWTDTSGNIYSTTSNGFSQMLTYAGTTYFLKYKYVPGLPSECSITVWEYTN